MLQDDSASWRDVWERKGRKAAGRPAYRTEDLFAIDGFDGALARFAAPAQQHIATLITESLGIRAGMQVLEAGSGAGATLSLLRSTGASLTGVDYSEPHLEIARIALPEAKFHVAEASSLPFPAGTFDAIFSYGVFLYFRDLDYATVALEEMVRVSRSSTRIMILDAPDEAKRVECEAARRAAGAALNPPHCYYPKHFFEDFARARKMTAIISDQCVPGYANSRFRFNALLIRN